MFLPLKQEIWLNFVLVSQLISVHIIQSFFTWTFFSDSGKQYKWLPSRTNCIFLGMLSCTRICIGFSLDIRKWILRHICFSIFVNLWYCSMMTGANCSSSFSTILWFKILKYGRAIYDFFIKVLYMFYKIDLNNLGWCVEIHQW